MEATDRLSLPLLIAGQAQKEVFHNEALQALDIVVAGAVEEPPRNDPPASPLPGNFYLVGEDPSGEWSQRARCVAAFGSGGWRFVTPTIGLVLLVKTTGTFATYGAIGWQVGTLAGSRWCLTRPK